MTAPKFRTGGDVAEEAAASASAGGGSRRVPYLSLKDVGDQEYVRFLTDGDEWITVDMIIAAPTKQKPAEWPDDRKWPSAMSAVSRYDEAFEGAYKDCYLLDSGLIDQWGNPLKAKPRTWALVCLREEVVGSQEMVDAGQITADQIGKRIGFRDKTREVKEFKDGQETGNVTVEKDIQVVNQAWTTFFDGLYASYLAYGKTICDRDFLVKRTAIKKDTKYACIPMDPTPNLKPGTEKWADKYTKSIEAQGIDLGQIVADMASDDYYALFFDPNKAAPSRGNKEQEQGQQEPAQQQAPVSTNEPDEETVKAMRERIRQGAGGSPKAAEPEQAEPAEQAEKAPSSQALADVD